MSLLIPYINPVRFHKSDADVEFPNVDQMTQRVTYQKGVYPTNVFLNFRVGQTIYIQGFSDAYVTGIQNISVIFNNTKQYMTLNNITPSGWSGNPENFIVVASYTFTQTGYYYIKIIYSDQYYSDVIYVHENEDNRLVKINYSDKQNRYGGYFYTGTTNVWNPTAYYTGNIIMEQPEDSQTVYDGESGNKIVTQSDPVRVATLTLTDIPSVYQDTIKQQTLCSEFYVNGVKYSVLSFDVSKIDKSDVVNITMKLSQLNNEYFLNL